MITMNDFTAEPGELRTAMQSAAARVFESGWYVLGKECKSFEARWAAACGTRRCLGVANGMDAIELALRGLEIGPGDEVVTTGMTAFATVLAIARAGATPVLADIDPDTGLLSPDSVERCLSPRTRALVLVHLYGQMRQMNRWTSLCEAAGIELIEDCAQSHSARWGGRGAGSFGAAGAWSFYPTKNLGAIGDGGALVTDRDDLADRVQVLRNYGQSERYVHPELGMNSRLDEIQAALLSVRLNWLDSFTARRREIARRYDGGLDHPSIRKLLAAEQQESHVHHLHVVCTPRRQALMHHLTACGVQALIHYPVPVHRQRPFLAIRSDPAGLSATEAHAATCLSLPCHPQLTDADLDHVVASVNSFAPG